MDGSFQRYNFYRLFVALATLVWAIWLVFDGTVGVRAIPVFRVVGVALGVLLVVSFGSRNRTVSTAFLLFQLALDVLVVSTLSDMSGGLYSLFTLLYFPTIGAGAYLLRRPGALWAAVFTTIGFVLMIVAHHGFQPSSNESLLIGWSEAMFRIFAFFLMALLTGQLGEQLARTGAALLEEQQTSRDLATEHDTVLDRVHAGVVSTDIVGNVVSVNPFAGRLLGEIVGRPLVDVLPAVGGESDTWEERRPDGERWVCTRAMLPTGGQVIVLEDVTELARMRESAARDERMVEAGRLAASLAHEIRNPLASMSGSLQMIREERPSRLADLALEESERLNRLVEDFLDVARRPVVVPRRVDIHAIATEVCESFAQDARYATKVAVRCEGGPTHVEADPDRVRQALWNLVLNGAQAMPRGGDITVSVRSVAGTVELGPGVEVVVADEGTGIPAEERARVFDPFYTTRRGGTGLGLLLVERIARGHGGHVHVSAHAPQGTRFHLWLPREAQVGA
ncbi:MAG: ATP-binding protein [Pseudomonadota bacterium]|nr:ATP-binding protein [Pseudomonadota bacterium]